jgi:hypothetical protein
MGSALAPFLAVISVVSRMGQDRDDEGAHRQQLKCSTGGVGIFPLAAEHFLAAFKALRQSTGDSRHDQNQAGKTKTRTQHMRIFPAVAELSPFSASHVMNQSKGLCKDLQLSLVEPMGDCAFTHSTARYSLSGLRC